MIDDVTTLKRRVFIASVAFGTLARPGGARAQPARKVARVGILRLETTADMLGPQAPGRRTPGALAPAPSPSDT